jgi:diguanylate cyclase (GGDEF)-like protein/PAS domain S-box-containing protein
MVATPGTASKNQEVLEKFVQAAAYTTGCLGAILILGRPGEWRTVAVTGNAPFLPIDTPTNGWLKMLSSYGDVVDVHEASPTAPVPPSMPTLGREGSLIFIALRRSAKSLDGALLMSVPGPYQRLSAAQAYALQTHGADITSALELAERTVANESLAVIERLRLLESVVVNAKDAILITSAEPIDLPGPKIVYCNPAFLAVTGFSLEEVMGQTPRILQCAETNRDTLDRLRHALTRWKPVEVELINARRDGTRFWVQLSIVPVANEKGWFTHWVSVQRDITERKEAELALKQAHLDREEKIALASRLVERERIQEELSYAAFHDDLTRLKNRAYFMARIQDAFVQFDVNQPQGATVLYLDLDRFKYINDGMGHRAGDTLLTLVATTLQACIDPDAVLARIGGDEFAILLTATDHAQRAIHTAELISRQLAMPMEIEGQQISTSCSVGIVTLNHGHETAEDLIRDADVAMYAAKKQGRGRWALFDLSMRQASIDLLFMQNALKHAITRNEFYLVYQPIFAVGSGQIEGVEALIRWHHPILGHIAPDVFVPIAEDIGVIGELGQWVMRTACTDVKGWLHSLPGCRIKLNVNVSGLELNHPGFVQRVGKILHSTGFSAQDLQIEITESVFLHEPDIVAESLTALRSLGIRIALDDFGIGYSSLGYIDRYPIDAIKIDRSFVSRMMTHSRSVAIVKSILSLGRALDLAIVAEGIESRQQLDLLGELGCPFVQGYMLSPPILGGDLLALLTAQCAPDGNDRLTTEDA